MLFNLLVNIKIFCLKPATTPYSLFKRSYERPSLDLALCDEETGEYR